MSAQMTNEPIADTAWAAAHLAELRRLTDDIETRLAGSDFLGAVSAVQGLLGRATDLGEFCAASFSSTMAEAGACAGPGQYL